MTTNYDWSIGSGGTMRIADTGTYVEFWITSNNTTSYNHALPWGYTVNGVTDNTNTYDYKQNAGWERLGSWNVTTDQTVTFRLYDTGTNSMGTGETHTLAVERATIPSPPTIVTLSAITSTGVTGTFADGANGGAAIDTRQIGYGTSSTTVQTSVTSDKSTAITGLLPGTTYYFWARTHNAKGWSAYGPRGTAKTLAVPAPPSTVVLSNIKQTQLDATFTDNANNGATVTAREIGYGTSSSAPTTTIASDGSTTITGLLPGTKYYFWARAQNSVGWSAYSAVAGSATMLAGVRVTVGSPPVVHSAIPWVRVGGVWKVAKPWVKDPYIWRETK